MCYVGVFHCLLFNFLEKLQEIGIGTKGKEKYLPKLDGGFPHNFIPINTYQS